MVNTVGNNMYLFALIFTKLVVGLVRCLLHGASVLLLDDPPV
jgi:hypothetical protein